MRGFILIYRYFYYLESVDSTLSIQRPIIINRMVHNHQPYGS